MNPDRFPSDKVKKELRLLSDKTQHFICFLYHEDLEFSWWIFSRLTQQPRVTSTL